MPSEAPTKATPSGAAPATTKLAAKELEALKNQPHVKNVTNVTNVTNETNDTNVNNEKKNTTFFKTQTAQSDQINLLPSLDISYQALAINAIGNLHLLRKISKVDLLFLNLHLSYVLYVSLEILLNTPSSPPPATIFEAIASFCRLLAAVSQLAVQKKVVFPSFCLIFALYLFIIQKTK